MSPALRNKENQARHKSRLFKSSVCVFFFYSARVSGIYTNSFRSFSLISSLKKKNRWRSTATAGSKLLLVELFKWLFFIGLPPLGEIFCFSFFFFVSTLSVMTYMFIICYVKHTTKLLKNLKLNNKFFVFTSLFVIL